MQKCNKWSRFPEIGLIFMHFCIESGKVLFAAEEVVFHPGPAHGVGRFFFYD